MLVFRIAVIFNLQRALLVLGGAALVVAVLYLLRERFRKAVVSFLPLWDEVMKKAPASALMRNFRRILSYLLQLLIIAVLILSITDTGYGKTKKRRAMAVLIDTSASMSAADVDPTRFQQARDFAVNLARSMKEDDEALLLEMSEPPRVVHPWTRSPDEIIEAAKALEVSAGGSDFVEALRLCASALEGMDAPEKEVWILSDGAFDPSSKNLRRLKTAVGEIVRKGITVHHYRTGKESANLAITRFSARQNLKEKLKLSTNIVINAFEQPEGGGGKKRKAGGSACNKINLRILSGGSTVFNKDIDKSRFGKIIPLDIPAPANRSVEARIKPADPACGQDFLAVDNTAAIELPEQLQLKILALTEENTYLMAVLLLSPLWEVEIIPPGAKPSRTEYDVVIADRTPVPEGVKRKGTLYFEPQFEGFPLEVKGLLEAPSFDEYDYNHPALRWTNLYNVNVAAAVHYAAGRDAGVLASSSQGPLILDMKAGEDRRDMVFAFSVSNTDMALRTTWPLLFINTLYYLAGTALQVSSASNSPLESNIMPRWIPKAGKVKKDPEAYRAFPLWALIILAALLLNMMEWVFFHRRWTV
jgi:hypothetical protein